MIHNRLLRIITFCALGLVVAVGIAWVQISAEAQKKQSALNRITPLADDPYGGPFTLVNQDGQTVTDTDFDGQYKLIYFGFTFCPAICPTELQKISAALDILGPEGESIQPIFITVDPERDTVETMKGYVALFHPRLVGLTGTRAQIDKALKGYKVYAAKVDDPSLSEYTMNHSSYIYFLDPGNRLLGLYKIDDTAQDVVRDIRGWLGQSPSG